MALETILSKLDKVKRQGKGYIACCPAHEDRNPSLSMVEAEDGRILIKCFAGCSTLSILGVMGLTMSDLFPEPLWKKLPNPTCHHGGNKMISDRKLQDRIDHLETKLAIAESMRRQGEKLSRQALESEREAYIELRKLSG